MPIQKPKLILTRQERSGIFYLLMCIFLFQGLTFCVQWYGNNDPPRLQAIGKLPNMVPDTVARPIYPFNPNFISDYKGYVLGMAPEEIGRLHRFRDSGGFVQTGTEFQRVTGISDSLLERIRPAFRFPEFKAAKKRLPQGNPRPVPWGQDGDDGIWGDLNTATAEDLQRVRGIGPVLSERIVRFRNLLGGFSDPGQLEDVYGLRPEVAGRVKARFEVRRAPRIDKLSVNQATAEELARIAYLNYPVAEAIVRYRELHGGIVSIEELIALENFPGEKIDRIKLYLSL